MDIKNIIQKIFTYTPENTHDFSILDNIGINQEENISENEFISKNEEIFPSIDVNLEFVKTKYNTLINSDIVLRDFIINARGKQYKAFIVYIDGMINSQMLNDFILKPLMMRNKNNLFDSDQTRIISEAVTNNVTVRKVKKFDLTDYLKSCLMPQNSIKEKKSFQEIFSGINSGNCALFVDTLQVAFDIEVKGFQQRSVEKPNNEIVVEGPHEAFVENIRTNTSLLRRIVNNEHLTIENIEVGEITKTKCAISYIKDIANNDLIAEVKFRINNLKIDSLLSTGQLEQLITDTNDIAVPQSVSTERPDKSASYLLEGRVVILVNGSPYALILPSVLVDFIKSPDDRNLKTSFANFVLAIRLLGAAITLLLPGIYISVTSFHQEFLPTDLLFSIIASRQNVPFPTIVEILIMEISFELIREAGLRVPSPIGPTIGIVGAIIIGQAAVSAGIVSPILIIIVAITGIASFTIPDYSFGFHLRLYRFIFTFLGYMAGSLGIALGIFAYLSVLCNIKSFGVPFMIGTSSLEKSKGHGYFLPQIWKRENRSAFLHPQKEKKQEKISMKWKGE